VRIVISCGEPAGIGPDLTIRAAQQSWPAQLLAIADAALLARRAAQLNLDLTLVPESELKTADPLPAGSLAVRHVPLRAVCVPGQLDVRNADYVLDALDQAVRGCIRKNFDALMTAPVHKGVINDAGHAFTGHTERIAELTGGYPVMLLVAGELRVALACTHLPLSEVSRTIKPELLISVLENLHAGLVERFGFVGPRILVCGLNPHAGEGGHLGREEIEVIAPTLEILRARGLNLIGPVPADTAFTPASLSQADAVLAMYHDQGLPVLKHAGFGHAVNVTLGVPIIRTSVDHGTALDMAGTLRPDPGSFEAALKLAIEMAKKRRER
jgi:4-hydroxythreonine-4-phosphate dehydrogenase